MTTVLITHTPGALATYFGARALSALEALAEIRRHPDERPMAAADLIAAAADCEFVIADRATAAPAEVFGSLPKLVAFSRCAVDIRNIDVAAAGANGILVTQASAGFMAAVSEWIIGVMIDLSRHITPANNAYHAARPPPVRMGRELRGSTIGIIGYGQIARYLARLALAFGMRVVVTDPHAEVSDAQVTQVALAQLLAEADFVVCLAKATAETENLVGADAFAAMQPTAHFINASRGNLVDEAALLAALDAGALAGCALDVGRADDQMPSPALARHPRVIATPHIGGLTPAAIEHQALEVVGQVAAMLQGKVPAGAVNEGQASRLRNFRKGG
jgi:D-3-phosphoglycerate dehydrogenase